MAGPKVSEPAAPATPVVKIVMPERKTIVHSIEQPGTLEAFEEAPLFARIPGYVQKVPVDIGDAVKGPVGKEAGQTLAELAVPEVLEEHRQKKALVKRAEAAVEQAAAGLKAAESRVGTAKALVREAEAGRSRAAAVFARWDSEAKRIGELVQKNVIDRQTLDETQNQLRGAEAGRQEADAKVLSAEASAKEAEANVAKAQADLNAAKAQVEVTQAEEGRSAALLQFGTLSAPFDGVVTRRNVNTGSFVQPPTGTGAMPLLVVARMDIVRVFLEVPEAEAMHVHDGMSAAVRVSSARNPEQTGTVKRSSWSLDPKARTLRVEVDLANPERELRPGMYAYVTLRAELKDRFVIPAAALATVDGKPACFGVQAGKAVLIPVKLGLRQGATVEVSAKQVGGSWQRFSGEERLAAGSLSELKDGAPVQIADEKKEKAAK